MLSTLTFRQLKLALEQSREENNSLFEEAASPDRWLQIRDDKHYATFWEGLEEQAAQLLENPAASPPFSDFILFGDTGDRSKYQDQRSRVFAGLHVFGLLAMTDDRPEWTKGLENAIWSICNEYTWVLPAHVGLYVNEYPHGIWDQPAPPRETVDLDSATAGLALAEVIHRLGDRLHPWVVVRAKAEIERRIFQVYFNDPVPQNWELKTNNWPAVCASSIGAAAIYMIEDSEKLAGMLWRVIGVLRQYLSGFDEQGATPEGPVYWQFGFSHLVYFAELLRERTAGRITLLDEPKIERVSQFPQFCLFSNGKVLNFSDAFEDVRFHTGLIHRLRRYFPSLSLPPEQYRMSDIQALWTGAARHMLWSLDQTNGEDRIEPDLQDRVQERIFTGNQWVISKVRQPEGHFAAFAAKGGYNEEPHNHNDLGHFILHVDGTTVLADIGIGVYTRQYFEPELRYQTVQAGSHGHSVPIVDGRTQSFGRKYKAQLLNSEATEDEVLFALDLTEAYECPSLKRLTREFEWRRPANQSPQLILTDKAEFHETPASYQEIFICGVEPEQAESRITIGRVELAYDPNDWDMEVEEQLSVSHYGDVKRFYRLLLNRRTLSASFECNFRFEIKS
ncbi:heparinase II/III family protein [Paenibacillus lignilyticus]|uniref:Heparinase II/III family protein n=1 Tax=Paenibacillus lignilyticus TaxID=1172615 RepID=A0ABS5CJ34_9BACL|nr:heparinase II/III family protein [Paenibacillus lignilyticus]MBP3965866.1 heparinase II/III family protein [Paenibacillus lignilyticus]